MRNFLVYWKSRDERGGNVRSHVESIVLEDGGTFDMALRLFYRRGYCNATVYAVVDARCVDAEWKEA